MNKNNPFPVLPGYPVRHFHWETQERRDHGWTPSPQTSVKKFCYYPQLITLVSWAEEGKGKESPSQIPALNWGEWMMKRQAAASLSLSSPSVPESVSTHSHGNSWVKFPGFVTGCQKTQFHCNHRWLDQTEYGKQLQLRVKKLTAYNCFGFLSDRSLIFCVLG